MVHEFLVKNCCCPSCRGDLTSKSGQLNCATCNVRYPELNGIPWLFTSPEANWSEWKDRCQYQVQKMATEIVQAQMESTRAKWPEQKQRLESIANALQHNARVLADLLKPIFKQAKPISIHEGIRSQLALSQKLMGYYSNILRDWTWGDAEFEAQDKAISKLAKGPWGNVLVLGAGAGRFANDFAHHAENLVALDINPLLVCIGSYMTNGNTMNYYEFPIAPQKSEDIAYLNECKAKNPAKDKLAWLLADGLNAPFKPGTFDTVVTPWFIDVIPMEFAELTANINHLLKPGGRWLNFGPCSFLNHKFEHQYPPNEILKIVDAGQFSVKGHDTTSMPYLNSPKSGQRREEAVFTFIAEKTGEAKPPTPYRHYPIWLEDTAAPVPVDEKFNHYRSVIQIQNEALALIDGKRSINQVAEKFGAIHELSPEDAQGAILRLLRGLFDG